MPDNEDVFSLANITLFSVGNICKRAPNNRNMLHPHLSVAPEVRCPVVAWGSTGIAHGMPVLQNVVTAQHGRDAYGYIY